MRPIGGWKMTLGAAAVAAAALVPLYGDPRVNAVSHTEWARMLVHGLDLGDAFDERTPASLVFSVLSWKTSLLQRADRYLRADGVEWLSAPTPRLEAVADPGEAAYPLAVARAGDYRVRLRLNGDTTATASVELARSGESDKAYSFTVRPPQEPGWVEVGVAHLSPGSWTASVALPLGTQFESIEVAPPCLNPIEPLGGWRAPKVTDNVDLSVTVLKALDLESELAPGADPLDIPASDFHSDDPNARSLEADNGFEGYSLAGGTRGARATVFVDVPEDGLYSIEFFGLQGAGQRWHADGCLKIVVCSEPEAPKHPAWHTLVTGRFSAGRHVLNVSLGPGAVLQRMRLVQRREGGQEYVAALLRLGFDPGPDGPITREKAAEALDFLKKRRVERPTPDCGDWDLPSGDPGIGGDVYPDGPGPGGPGGGGPGGPGGGPPPVTPPGVPPQNPASPVLP